MKSKEASPELVRLVAKDIDSMGHTRVVVKGDNEPAMHALLARAREARTHPTIVEEAPEYEPQSNGRAERCVHMSKGLYITMRSALEHRIGRALPDEHPAHTWMIRHAACLHNRYDIGVDGRTPWERVAGKRNGAAVAEFGEKVMFLTRRPNKENKWSFGTLLGLVTRTQETYIGSAEGVVRAWTIKRIAEQERWNADELLAMRGTVQQPDPRREGENVHICIAADANPAQAPAPPRVAPPHGQEFLYQTK